MNLCPADSMALAVGEGLCMGISQLPWGKPGHLLAIRSSDFYLKLEDWTCVLEGQVWGQKELVAWAVIVLSLLWPPALKLFISTSLLELPAVPEDAFSLSRGKSCC